MKKIIIIFVLAFCFGKLIAAPTITKTASVASAFIGDQFDYTISVSGITNLSELNSIVDNLGPNLQFISSDFTTMPFMSVYGIFCSSSLPPVLTVSAGNILTINFPSGCSTPISGTFSFKIKVKVKESACTLKGVNFTNSITLNTNLGATSASSTIAIESGVPWKLQKNYLGFATGIFEYDVRLNAVYGGYNSQVLFGTSMPMFSDTFFLPTCIPNISPSDLALSTVDYIEETSGLAFGPADNLTKVYNSSIRAIIFTWDLPPVSFTSGRTFNAYYYKIKIKTTGCSCPSTTFFDINNKVNFNAVDQCGIAVNLEANAVIKNLQCSGTTIFVPSKDTLCVQKTSDLGPTNLLNLFMPGCTGTFTIRIWNCSNFAKYSNVNFTDFAPANVTFGTPVYSGPGTPSFAGSNSSQVVFNYTAPPALIPGWGLLTIKIPFTVSSTFPSDTKLINCVTINAVGTNIITSTPLSISKTVCDSSKRSVPTQPSAFLEKKLCNSASRNCGGFTSTDFMPNDTAIYMLHYFNYGSGTATNVSLSDVLPNHLTIINPAADIKVFKYVGGTWDVMGTCDTAMATNINVSLPISVSSTTASSRSFNPTTNLMQINFGPSHNLDGFTCSGITHYFVRIKAKIKATAPDGIYNNAFKINYNAPTPQTNFSNNVSLTVNNDNMLVFDKTVRRSASNCDKQQDTVEYEIKIANLSQVPIAYNIKDQITLPAGVTLSMGIFNLKYCLFTTGVTCTPTTSFTSPTITPTSFIVANQILNPCQVIVIRYKVIYNTGALPPGAAFGKNVCNNMTIEAGYPEWVYRDWDIATLPPILLSKNADHIDGFLTAKTKEERFSYKNLMRTELRKENNGASKKIFKDLAISYTHGYYTLTFTPIITGSDNNCLLVSSCLNGIRKACFNSDADRPVTFKIDSVNSIGKVFTKLSISTSTRINRIEYVLSDIRMVETCHLSGWRRTVCSPCGKNLTGLLINNSGMSLGALLMNPTGFPPNPMPFINNYLEKNTLNFSSFSYQNLNAVVDTRKFQLPVTSLNCGGRLELVMTVIIHYEDCSICYISDAYKYNAFRTWTWIGTGGVVIGDLINVSDNGTLPNLNSGFKNVK
jgi:uncharacterized repeat protein (TIGR01451 family)